MSKKQYAIRLYTTHDIDLITFMQEREFNIMKAIYSSLNAFCNHDVFVIELPPKREVPLQINKRIYRKTLTLHTERDKAIIELLDSLRDGMRNNFIKNLLRLYLCNPISTNALVNPASEEKLLQMFEVLKKGKRRAKAGNMKRKKNSTGSNQRKVDPSAVSASTKTPTIPDPVITIPNPDDAPVVKEKASAESASEQNTQVDDQSLTDLFCSLIN